MPNVAPDYSAVTDGSRVGALHQRRDDGVYELLGYGTFEGREVPVGAAGVLALLACASSYPVPRIRLDSGEIVWGCECWWAPEADVRELLAHENVVERSITDVRRGQRVTTAADVGTLPAVEATDG